MALLVSAISAVHAAEADKTPAPRVAQVAASVQTAGHESPHQEATVMLWQTVL